MKKFLLLFIPILTFSFLFTTNKTYAQKYTQGESLNSVMTVTDLTGYTWIANDTITTANSTGDYFINFTSNDTNFIGLIISNWKEEVMGFGENILMYKIEPYNEIQVCSGTIGTPTASNWTNDAYKTIIITGGDDVTNPDLIAWLQANGTLIPPQSEPEYPDVIMKVFYDYYLYDVELDFTYQFKVSYVVYDVIIDSLDESEYFLVNDLGIGFRKGVVDGYNINSYYLDYIYWYPEENFTEIRLTVRIDKNLAVQGYDFNPGIDDGDIGFLFMEDTALYILNLSSDDRYDVGYQDGFRDGRFNGISEGYDLGYNAGKDVGYDLGYNDGINASQPEVYQRGFEDGRKSTLTRFIDNFHVWFIPAVIIVFTIGVFVSYKKGRDE